MKIRTEKMTSSEIKVLKELLVEHQYLFGKITVTVCIILLFIFFMPAKISSFFNFENNMVSNLFRFKIDRLFFYFIIAPSVILYLIYAYLLNISKIKADLKHQIKEIGIIRVKERMSLDEGFQEHNYGVHNSAIVFEKNSFKISSISFSSHKQPELYYANAFEFHVSKFAKIELRRKVIHI